MPPLTPSGSELCTEIRSKWTDHGFWPYSADHQGAPTPAMTNSASSGPLKMVLRSRRSRRRASRPGELTLIAAVAGVLDGPTRRVPVGGSTGRSARRGRGFRASMGLTQTAAHIGSLWCADVFEDGQRLEPAFVGVALSAGAEVSPGQPVQRASLFETFARLPGAVERLAVVSHAEAEFARAGAGL